MPSTNVEEIEAVIASMFEAFNDVPKPQQLRSCDCGVCFFSIDTKTLYSQSLESMDIKLLNKCFTHYSVTEDKEGLRFLLPAFAKSVLVSTISGNYALNFFTWDFGRLLRPRNGPN